MMVLIYASLLIESCSKLRMFAQTRLSVHLQSALWSPFFFFWFIRNFFYQGMFFLLQDLQKIVLAHPRLFWWETSDIQDAGGHYVQMKLRRGDLWWMIPVTHLRQELFNIEVDQSSVDTRDAHLTCQCFPQSSLFRMPTVLLLTIHTN